MAPVTSICCSTVDALLAYRVHAGAVWPLDSTRANGWTPVPVDTAVRLVLATGAGDAPNTFWAVTNWPAPSLTVNDPAFVIENSTAPDAERIWKTCCAELA